ncbi:MAG: HAD-IA family hydrolase [Pseudomonadota bacterium]
MTNAGVLFDLDGTLVDTAPDLVGALFAVCDGAGVARPDYATAARYVSLGGRGLVGLAFERHDKETQEAAYQSLLTHYAAHIAEASRPYAAWPAFLAALELPWGIVTNKPQRLAEQLLGALELPEPGCIVGGDLLPLAKPAPDPLIYAAGRIDVLPQHCVYLGDHARDMEAARAAGMHALGVSYGYLLESDDPATWPADAVAASDGEAVVLLTDILHTLQEGGG